MSKDVENEKARVTVASRPSLPKFFAKGSMEEKGKAVRNVHERVEKPFQDDILIHKSPAASVAGAHEAQVRESSEEADQTVSMKSASCGFLEQDVGTTVPIVRSANSTEVATPIRTSPAAADATSVESR